MSIDRLSPLSALFAAIRLQAIGKKSGAAVTQTSITTSESGGADKSYQSHDRALLRQQIVEIARGLDLEDAKSVADARLRVIRSVLLWEHGPGLREYSQWQHMIDKVNQDLELNGDSMLSFRQLMSQLAKE